MFSGQVHLQAMPSPRMSSVYKRQNDLCPGGKKHMKKKGQTRGKNLGGQEALVDWSNGYRFVKSSVLQSKEGKRKANTLHLSVRHLIFFSTFFRYMIGISLVSHTFNETSPNTSTYVQYISAFQQTRGLSTICWKICPFRSQFCWSWFLHRNVP